MIFSIPSLGSLIFDNSISSDLRKPRGLVLPDKLGLAAAFGALAGAAISGTAYIVGDVGSGAGAISPTVTSSGTIYPTGDATVITALADFVAAYEDAKNLIYDVLLSAAAYDLGGDTLTAGVYKIGADTSLSSTLTLDGQNNPNSLFVIQIVGTLGTTASVGNVVLSNSAQGKNVIWVVESAVTIGPNSHIEGTILAGSSITCGTNSTINGRALAGTVAGAITFGDTTIVTVPT